MHSNLKSYIYSIFILAIIATSCSKEEFTELTPIEPVITNDTIIIDDQVILRNGNEVFGANGVFSTCLGTSNTLFPRPYDLTINLFAFGVDFDSDIDPADWENDVYFMTWYTCGALEPGRYLAEGLLLKAGGLEVVEINYNVIVESVSESEVKGSFEVLSGELEIQAGSFGTMNYGCDMIDPADELIVRNTYGRLYSDNDNETEDLALQCVSQSCENMYTDFQGEALMIFGGGQVYLDFDRNITYDEDPELMILIDPTVVAISNQYQAYMITDLSEILNTVVEPSFESLSQMGFPIQVNIIEETETYIKGTYSGMSATGEIISGSFLSEHRSDC